MTIDNHGCRATFDVEGDPETLKMLAEFMANGDVTKALSMKIEERRMSQPKYREKKCEWCEAGVGRVLALFIVKPGGDTKNLGAVCAQCAEQIMMLRDQIKVQGA